MLYALRDPSGQITSLHRTPVHGSEALAPDHPEVIGLLAGAESVTSSFASLDADLVRVLEDLVDVLIRRQVIRITDLPPAAQHKLFARKQFRERHGGGNSLKLFGAGDDVLNTDLGQL
jgi:hypothetical protein